MTIDPVKVLTAFFVNSYDPASKNAFDAGAHQAAAQLAKELDVEFGADGDTIEMALRETFKGN
jgi:hypothetical protein